MLSVHFAREARLEQWRIPLLGSMPLNSEIRSWGVADRDVGYDNLLTLASCALEPHRKLGCVQGLELGLFKHDATWAQLAGLLTQPVIRAFSEIIVWTTRVNFRKAERIKRFNFVDCTAKLGLGTCVRFRWPSTLPNSVPSYRRGIRGSCMLLFHAT